MSDKFYTVKKWYYSDDDTEPIHFLTETGSRITYKKEHQSLMNSLTFAIDSFNDIIEDESTHLFVTYTEEEYMSSEYDLTNISNFKTIMCKGTSGKFTSILENIENQDYEEKGEC